MNEKTGQKSLEGVAVTGSILPEYEEILSPQALVFLAKLQRAFNNRRKELLLARVDVQKAIDRGDDPGFPRESVQIRQDDSWRVAAAPPDLQKRWVEITGPTDRKMMINALNSGADVFMADFEDANSPTWDNMVTGQINLRDAVNGTISFTNPDGKLYTLQDETATLMVRPRGWHLVEKHLRIDGEPVSGSLFDFGLFFFHNARRLIDKGSGPYFYLAKLEHYREARLWNDVFNLAQDELEIPRGTIRATVLIENILAALQMEEILYELRDHSAGQNAGRWDYIFSVIKKFRHRLDYLPDRGQITMTVPFMRAYTELLVRTNHKRGAHAMGGMAAYIPSRRDPEVNEIALEKVREDKRREANDGFDGTWVAHPDLVPVAGEVFQQKLGQESHQKERLRQDVDVRAADLLDFEIQGGVITEAGLRQNINVALQYLANWLDGTGAVAIYNLMEDTATAEISRAQLWQWVHSQAAFLEDGRPVTAEFYQKLVPEELEKIEALYGKELFEQVDFEKARQLLDRLVLNDEFDGFLTLVAYEEFD